LALSGSWLTGESHEYVYENGDKLSELIWDMQHAFVISADLGLRLTHALKFNIKGSIGGHIDNYMEDYDWLARDYGVSDWTDRSQHDDTELDHFARIDFSLQYDFLSTDRAALGALLGLRYASVQWSAYGGSYIYTSDPSTTFRDQVGTFDDDELGITYEQDFATPYLGLAASLSHDRVSLRGSLVASPFSFIETKDDHWLRDLTLTADYEPTGFIAAEAEASYRLNHYAHVFINVAAEQYREAEGDSNYDYYSLGGSFDLEDGAGAEHQNLQLSLGFRISN
jgi:outer membrane protease